MNASTQILCTGSDISLSYNGMDEKYPSLNLIQKTWVV
uniref:Uncharacterized protein n=1 Tax=Utricularia reniformis TaxID=192314 RepID=A0A1Y0B4D7_9LAMI|nr:hypothetical protein AEK19_MT2107 [Utricularia reniformis]ART32260.1 hypothetical protein AEK19_MT2107 [Utricularia reniformis]